MRLESETSFANHLRPSRGFTIVELLIVIVVIAILAAISLVSYNGVQMRARDSNRQADVKSIAKALELYYIDNGKFPNGSGSTAINNSWSTTADASWANLATALRPYLASLPSDPTSTAGINVTSSGSTGMDYAYFSNSAGTYCGVPANQMFILVYRFEQTAQAQDLIGTCNPTVLGPYSGASNYRVAK